MKLLTNLIFEPKGKHDPALAYTIKDTVMSADGSKVYFAVQDVPANTPLVDEDYWKLQIDLSGSKHALDEAAAAFADQVKFVGTRVKGETAKATGNPVSFLPDAGSLLQPVTVMEPQQEGSGDPSPNNIRPFIGYEKLDLTVAGKNLLENTATSQTINGVTFTVNADGSITANGTATDVVFFNVGRVLLESGVSYVLSGCPAGGNNGGNFLMYVSIGSEFYYDFGSSVSFEGTGETRSVFIQVKSGATVDATFYPMIRLASDPDATYAPYASTFHTVQIGQTVYGIRYEWLTGKGVIEWAMVTLTDNHGFYLGDVGEAKRLTVVGVISGADNESNGENVNLYCTHYKSDPSPINANNVNNAICGYQQDGNVYIRDDRFNTYEEAAAYFAAQNVAGTPVQVCWKLAQPIEIQLTPHIISAVELEQNNTLYGDGTIEVEYVKPLHVSIEERVAAALAAAAE